MAVSENNSTRKRWKLYFEAGKAPTTTHWDFDYLPTSALEDAYLDDSGALAHVESSRKVHSTDSTPPNGTGTHQNSEATRLSVRATRISNFLLYQFGWLAVVVGVASGFVLTGTTIAIGLVAVHLILCGDRSREVALVFASVAVGLAVDSTLLACDAIRFETGNWLPLLPPLWMSVLWAQFATTLNHSLRWLSGTVLAAAAFGLLGGPLAYVGGEALGAVVIEAPRWMSLLWLGGLWLLALPVITFIARHLRRDAPAESRYWNPLAILASLESQYRSLPDSRMS